MATPTAKAMPSEITVRKVLMRLMSSKRKRSSCVKPIALSFDRRNDRGLARTIQFAAQSCDVDVDEVGAGIEIILPDLFEDDASAHHLARMPSQKFEQFELHMEKLYGFAGDFDRAADEVDFKVAGADDRSLETRPMPAQ